MTQPSPPSRPAQPSLAQSTVAERLAEIVGERHVLSRASELLVYNSDGLPGYRRQPRLAVFPGTREETIAVVRMLAEEGLPFVPRGAGTGLSGGALADDIVVIGLHRLKKIISLDVDNRRATVEPGVVNLRLNKHVAPYGLLYAPDPSSEAACTIGGNVAENAGGPHCLKYGVTLNHVLALTVVLPNGEVVELGRKVGEREGYDLRGAFIGSEGCFGLALDITVKLTPKPQTVRTLLADFMSVDAAAHVTSAIIASGIVPAALEFMDGQTIRVVEDSIYAAGYPRDAEAILLIELDGLEAGVSADLEAVRQICIAGGARNVKVARDDAERMKLWQGRKKAFGAMGRMAPHLIVQDAVIPRTRLPEILDTIRKIGEKYRVVVCNVFHAGDGNLHPNIPYSADDPEESERVHKAMTEIMQACIDAGGSITGEHGVGLDKMGYMEAIFSESSLNAMCELRGVFDPERRSNPGKVVPLHACKEWNAVARSRLRMSSSTPADADDDLPGATTRPLEAEPAHPSTE
jgi:glycolate oxidase subunit GlcD